MRVGSDRKEKSMEFRLTYRCQFLVPDTRFSPVEPPRNWMMMMFLAVEKLPPRRVTQGEENRQMS